MLQALIVQWSDEPVKYIVLYRQVLSLVDVFLDST